MPLRRRRRRRRIMIAGYHADAMPDADADDRQLLRHASRYAAARPATPAADDDAPLDAASCWPPLIY